MAAKLNFWSTVFWIIGGASFTYYAQLIIALHQFIEKDYAFAGIGLGKWFNSEAAVFTCTFMWLPLVVIHLAAWFYVRAAELADNPRPRYPDSVFSISIPPDQAWLRIVLVILLLVAPSAGYIFTVGRTFSHYGIVYIDTVREGGKQALADAAKQQSKAIAGLTEDERRNAVIPGESQAAGANAVRGMKLLTSRPDAKGRSLDWNSSGWNWVNCVRDNEVRPFPEDITLKIPHLVKTQALPILQPWGFLLMAAGLAVSTIALLLRGWIRQPHEGSNALADS